jgi:hypothetical protein
MSDSDLGFVGKMGRRFGRADILFWTLPWLMVLIVWGTIAQKDVGLFTATEIYFSSFYFMWQGLPLPGGYTVLTIMTVNLICKFIFLSPWTFEKIGIHIIHLSIIILMIGGLLTAVTIDEGFVAFSVNDTKSEMSDFEGGEMFIRSDMSDDSAKTPLPYDITLDNFRREVYDGTNMPKLYESHVTITDGDLQFPAIIGMNEPLRYGGYALYQASTFINNEGRPVSVLNIVTNDGWLFPYLSGILLALGLIIHIIIRAWPTR